MGFSNIEEKIDNLDDFSEFCFLVGACSFLLMVVLAIIWLIMTNPAIVFVLLFILFALAAGRVIWALTRDS